MIRWIPTLKATKHVQKSEPDSTRDKKNIKREKNVIYELLSALQSIASSTSVIKPVVLFCQEKKQFTEEMIGAHPGCVVCGSSTQFKRLNVTDGRKFCSIKSQSMTDRQKQSSGKRGNFFQYNQKNQNHRLCGTFNSKQPQQHQSSNKQYLNILTYT